MNRYIYLITNTKTKQDYIGIRECHCDIKDDKYKGENTLLLKEFKSHGKKTFKKSVLATIPEKSLTDEIFSIYLRYYDCIVLSEGEEPRKPDRSNISGSNHRLSRKVICLNTGNIYNSIGEASKALNICKSNIIEACSPKYTRTHAGKTKFGEELKWMYHDEYIAKSNGEDYIYTETQSYPSINARRVRCIQTGDVFESIAEASKAYNLNSGSISNSCNRSSYHSGKHSDTGASLKWEFIDSKEL